MIDETQMHSTVEWVDIDSVSPNPYQPRREFVDESLTELAESIAQYGILQPLTVSTVETTDADGTVSVHYELVAGERRLRASKLAGLKRVPVIIRIGDSNKTKLELAIIENLQREDLNPVDRAKAFLQLASEFNLTHTEIGKRMGKSREYVSNSLRLLALPADILDALSAKKISEGHTRPLLMLADKPAEQKILFNEIINYKMSVRAAEVRARKSAQEKVRKENLKTDPKILGIEETLSKKLRARVAIETGRDGNSGRIVINYMNAAELGDLIRAVGDTDGSDVVSALQAQSSLMLEKTEKSQTKTAEPKSFALKTGFLDNTELSDDNEGDMLSRELVNTADDTAPKQFALHTNALETTHTELPQSLENYERDNDITETNNITNNSQNIQNTSDSATDSINTDEISDEWTPLSSFRFAADTIDTDTEPDDELTIADVADIEASDISESELDTLYTKHSDNNTTINANNQQKDPALYSALFNL
jgi:ParB family transcriptional regulator, chromosome partitioning protein